MGEVVLLAILKEFGLEKSRFGQLALGIDVFDSGLIAQPLYTTIMATFILQKPLNVK